ncbi:acyltransferase Pun1-like [Nicotiana tabacum]|uniref:Acylsugar acyltransferase 3-like n=1 Tax=Nicotiana tabacum TaxID=4097 RepID=A0A1S3Y6L8_TOBAC|nr:PREDICTED: acylsugar acyltransferase 3-like [Nicotiana tabacum]
MTSSRLISVSEKIIKPFSATPSPLRHYKLSLIDQLMSTMYIPIAFFYRRPLEHKIINKSSKLEVSQTLEKSLSKTLSSYYPFAGKLKDNLSIECNDMGAKFLNVELNCSMSEVVNLPDTGPEYLAFPKNLPWNSTSYYEGTNYFVVAQLSHFRCGEIAVSACLSHKIGDGCTEINFMNDWATIARSATSSNYAISRLSTPQWIGASIFPPTYDDHSSAISRITPNTLPYITKRYVFSSSKLSALKKFMASDSGGVQNPTRNEVVTALLYKCANMATSRSSSGSGLFKPSALIQVVNLRPRLNPPLPNNSAGNLISSILIKSTDEEQMKVARIVQDLRKEKEQLNMKHDLVNQNGVVLSALEYLNDTMDVYCCSSLCNYQLYNVDFGWGKPERVVVTNGTINFFLLSDDKNGDGIEVLVSLGKEVMSEFNNNKELLEFAFPVSN